MSTGQAHFPTFTPIPDLSFRSPIVWFSLKLHSLQLLEFPEETPLEAGKFYAHVSNLFFSRILPDVFRGFKIQSWKTKNMSSDPAGCSRHTSVKSNIQSNFLAGWSKTTPRLKIDDEWHYEMTSVIIHCAWFLRVEVLRGMFSEYLKLVETLKSWRLKMCRPIDNVQKLRGEKHVARKLRK